MSVQVSYKKQFALGIMLLLVILTIIEASARTYEYQNPSQFCRLMGADVFKETDDFTIRDVCQDHLFLAYEKGHVIEMAPDQHLRTININNFGFRGPDITLEKPDNTYRIFVVGGSTLVGGGSSSDSATITGFLQQKFDNVVLDFKVQVINAGVPGQYSFGEWYHIRTKIPAFEPDLIIVYDGWNDAQNRNWIAPDIEKMEKQAEIAEREITIANFPYYRTPYVIYNEFSKSESSSSPAIGEESRSETVRLWKTRWIETCELAKNEGYEMLIALQPIVGGGNKPLSETEQRYAPNNDQRIETVTIMELLAKSLDEVGKLCEHTTDLRNIFDDVSEPIYFDQGHMSDFGNEIVAQKLFEESLPIVRGS